MRTLPLLVLLAACAANPPPIGTLGPSDTGGHTATTLADSGSGPAHSAGPTHSAYVVPDLPPPTPGPLELEPVASGVGTSGYVLELVVAGPQEWDQFVAEELAAGCPHYIDDGPCRPLPDAATVGITNASSWLVFTPDRFGTGSWNVHGAEVTALGEVEVRWSFCGDNDDLAVSGRFFPIPRAAYIGVTRINEFRDEPCSP
jgi:hypothetical protein